MSEKSNTKRLSQTAMYAALIVLAIYFIRIPMPSAISNTFVHPGNALVILAVLLMGFKYGSLAALVGLAIFDITSGYFPVVWMTLLENFIVLLLVEGVDRYLFKHQHTKGQIVALGIIGAVTKIMAIFIKYVIQQSILGSSLQAAMAVALTAMPASLFTGLVTAILVPVLYWPLKAIFDRKN